MFGLKSLVKPLLFAAAIALPGVAGAATINGQIDISGTVNLGTSSFTPTGSVDLNNPGTVMVVTGDFATFAAVGHSATMTDVDFTTPGQIWTVDGFTFTAASFSNIVDGLFKTFTAAGTIAGNGFDATVGILNFSAQDAQATVSFSTTTTAVPLPASSLLLLGGLGSLVALRRRRRKAA